MLSAADLRLMEADPRIPGLRLILDDRRVQSTLSEAFPHLKINDVRSYYIRYKKGVNCLVGFKADIRGEPQYFYAKAYAVKQESKLNKFRPHFIDHSLVGRKDLILPEEGLAFHFFPNDSDVKGPARLFHPRKSKEILQAVFPGDSFPPDPAWTVLRYKPQRRCIMQLSRDGKVCYVLKCYDKKVFPAAREAYQGVAPGDVLRLQPRIGSYDRYKILAFPWLDLASLDQCLRERREDVFVNVGRALREFHRQEIHGRDCVTKEAELARLDDLNREIAVIAPFLERTVNELVLRLKDCLLAQTYEYCFTHGDFYADQLLVGGDKIYFLDLDRCVRANRCNDLGQFFAHLEKTQAGGHLESAWRENIERLILKGYAEESDEFPGRVELYKALWLLRLSVEPFRRREPSWEDKTRELVERSRRIMASSGSGRAAAPSGAVTLKDFRDQAALEPRLRRCVARHYAGRGITPKSIWVETVRLARSKPGKRYLIEYDLRIKEDSADERLMTLMAKVRVKGLKKSVFQLQRELWDGSFGLKSTDGILVPEPVGCLAEYGMWCYWKAPGVACADLFFSRKGVSLAGRVAKAAYKIHTCGITPSRSHTIDDELNILADRLHQVAGIYPRWRERISGLLAASRKMGRLLGPPFLTGIHRDFYADQILVDEERAYVIDWDMFSFGDAAVDIGNFLGHLTEASLRRTGDPDYLREEEEALERQYLDRAGGEGLHKNIHIYKWLTLARHVFISTLFPDRRIFAERLLELCEEGIEKQTACFMSGVGNDTKQS